MSTQSPDQQPGKPESDSKYRAPALDKGLDILELLSQQPNSMTRAQIIKSMGRRPGEIYRMLERLVAREYVSRSVDGDRYELTMKLFLLGSQYPPTHRLVAQAMPLMNHFADLTLQSVHLVVPDRGAAVVVAQASCQANWEFRLRIGSRLELLDTGSGQTLLAFQSVEKRNELLATVGNSQSAIHRSWKSIESALQDVRDEGFRIGDSKQLAGVQDISVPIAGVSGSAVGVLTCPYIQRLEKTGNPTTSETLAQLQSVAVQLSLHQET